MDNVKGLAILTIAFVLVMVSVLFLLFRQPGDPVWLFGVLLPSTLMVIAMVVYLGLHIGRGMRKATHTINT